MTQPSTRIETSDDLDVYHRLVMHYCLVFSFAALLSVNLIPSNFLCCISSAPVRAECVAFYFSFLFLIDFIKLLIDLLYVSLSRQQPH